MPLDSPTSAGAALRVAVPTQSERRTLLRALLVGRGIERTLAQAGADATAAGEDVLAAIAAASGLERSDRLVVPRSLVTAHLASNADPDAIAAARVGTTVAGGATAPRAFASESASGLALGIALALHQAGDEGVALAILARRWVEGEACRRVLSIAAERRLPLAVVSLGAEQASAEGIAVVDRCNLEAVRAAVREAVSEARDGGPVTVVCGSPATDGDAARRARFRSEPPDPVTIYERRLMINGFTRATLAEVRADATAVLERALAGLVPGSRRLVQ